MCLRISALSCGRSTACTLSFAQRGRPAHASGCRRWQPSHPRGADMALLEARFSGYEPARGARQRRIRTVRRHLVKKQAPTAAVAGDGPIRTVQTCPARERAPAARVAPEVAGPNPSALCGRGPLCMLLRVPVIPRPFGRDSKAAGKFACRIPPRTADRTAGISFSRPSQ